MTEKVDEGKIIIQKKVDISPDETPETLKDKVQRLEQECFIESLQLVIEGKLSLGNS